MRSGDATLPSAERRDYGNFDRQECPFYVATNKTPRLLRATGVLLDETREGSQLATVNSSVLAR